MGGGQYGSLCACNSQKLLSESYQKHIHQPRDRGIKGGFMQWEQGAMFPNRLIKQDQYCLAFII